MTRSQWHALAAFRTDLKAFCVQSLRAFGYPYMDPHAAQSAVACCTPQAFLHRAQAALVRAQGIPTYPVHTPIVYPHALEELTQSDPVPALILVSDNPGKEEQLHTQQRYLVGQSGRVAQGFFSRHAQLGFDFRTDVMLLNKTPLHTAKTVQLRALVRLLAQDPAGTARARQVQSFLHRSQCWMARRTCQLQRSLGCDLWIVGYSELKSGHLFEPYARLLQTVCDRRTPLFVFQHFSMNCFARDFAKARARSPQQQVRDTLKDLGLHHRQQILGF